MKKTRGSFLECSAPQSFLSIQYTCRRDFPQVDLCNHRPPLMAFASSSSSIVLSKCEFDVFVSFRGADTRHDFTSHLVKYLRGKGIDVFSDAKLRGGEYISLLFDRIEQSKMSIVVFSEDYANSWWCLEEVGKIMQRRKEFNHGVLPIFYKVSKSDVSNQTGSFEAAFQSPTKIFNGDEQKIEELKVALKTASNIRGFVYPENSSEPDFLDEIVKNTFRMLNELSPCVIPDDLPGIESRSKELEKLLMFDNDECVRVVGVLGMTGIGKTTVADIVYKQNFQRFDGYEFLEDIEDNSKRYGLPYLYQKLLHKLLDGENVDVRAQGRPENFLRNKKLFIVLDNVTEEKQIEYLIGKKNVYRQGSRIVIITRDKKLLQKNADATYVVPRLNDREAMELFCLQVFGNHYPTEEFVDLSNDFVCYAKGLPLALKLLGKGLLTHDINYWKKKLEFLQVNPDKELQKELKSSYKALDDDQKSVFLDIACFFRSEKADFVSSILKSDDIDAKDVMRELEEKCLVTISYDRIEMHDLLHAMGKEIGKEKSIRKAGERRRLWNHKDIRDILEHNTGTECVRGIFLNMSEVRRIKLFPAAFTMLSKLKFLKFHSSHCSQWCDNDHIFQCSKVPDHFPDELVYLHWQGYPYDCLPSDFDPKELVDLSLRYSHIKQLWEDEKNTESLRWVDLGQSKDLLNLSGLSRAKNLERLDLEGCTSLDLLGSVKQMNELIYLNLRDCTSLESLPKGFKIKSLKTLILSGCLKLKDFHIISESIESLHLEGTAIERVVEHIESLHSLILLNLKNCEKLKYLPNDLYKLKSLQELVLSGCSALESLPPIKEKMECLEILLMDGTSIKQTPEMSCLSNLKICSFCRPVIDDSTGLVVLPFSGNSFLSDLYLTNCNIDKLPDNFSSLRSLRCLCLSRNNIETLPESIEKLYSLLLLDLKHCCRLKSLPLLPSNLQYLDAHGCGSLENVSKPLTIPLVTERMHTTFIFTDCFKLNQAEKEDIVAQAQLKSQLLARTSRHHNHKGLLLDPLVAVCFPGHDIPSWFSHQKMGSLIETDLLPHWCNSKFIGASLCVVVTFKDHEGHHANRLSVRCKSKFKSQNGQFISFSFCLGGWNESCGSSCHEPRKLGSDHVFISYNNCNVPVFKWSEETNEGNRCHPTSASFEFYLTDETERKLECCEILRCGMNFLYARDENDRKFQGIRVTDTVERTSSEALVTIRGQSHSRIEERRYGRIRDEIMDMTGSSMIGGPES